MKYSTITYLRHKLVVFRLFGHACILLRNRTYDAEQFKGNMLQIHTHVKVGIRPESKSITPPARFGHRGFYHFSPEFFFQTANATRQTSRAISWYLHAYGQISLVLLVALPPRRRWSHEGFCTTPHRANLVSQRISL